MPVPLVFARPDRLRRFRLTAGALAEGLTTRQVALADAVDHYRSLTERAYEADCEAAVDAIRALGRAVQELGEWVGRVGDAFDELPSVDGVNLGPVPDLLAALPPELRLTDVGNDDGNTSLGDVDLAGTGLTLVRMAALGAHPRDLAAVAAVVGPERATGRALAGAAQSVSGHALGRFLDGAQAVASGAREGWRRWESEPDREAPERVGRAAVDGLLNAAGGFGGSSAGAAAGSSLCAGSVVAGPLCASVGARAGGALGATVAERISDWALGDEPERWERDPGALAAEVADADPTAEGVAPMLEEAAADAEAAARRHADFVLDHPWLWDDEYADAPEHAAPPPAADVPVDGPR
jgi:hypothetical protein